MVTSASIVREAVTSWNSSKAILHSDTHLQTQDRKIQPVDTVPQFLRTVTLTFRISIIWRKDQFLITITTSNQGHNSTTSAGSFTMGLNTQNIPPPRHTMALRAVFCEIKPTPMHLVPPDHWVRTSLHHLPFNILDSLPWPPFLRMMRIHHTPFRRRPIDHLVNFITRRVLYPPCLYLTHIIGTTETGLIPGIRGQVGRPSPNNHTIPSSSFSNYTTVSINFYTHPYTRNKSKVPTCCGIASNVQCQCTVSMLSNVQNVLHPSHNPLITRKNALEKYTLALDYALILRDVFFVFSIILYNMSPNISPHDE